MSSRKLKDTAAEPAEAAAVVPIEPARAAQAAARGEIKLVEADAAELRQLDALLAQVLQRLGRARLDVVKGAAVGVEYAVALDALRAEERYAAKVAEIGRANGVPIGQEPWTFDFSTMRFFRTPRPASDGGGAGA